ncbi:hypothetical protein [Microbacterium sp. PRC9]|uniref:hypothetical protein n=1 Tax=Microbacterium sp. PRC9 TaxID=2962591 RepID=UPI002880F551|nr:hypothetical protein [Microbacterium sp. PRC9]MDT0143082.1 hypothetical protein [Microbacterium sp. PRC9]
MSPTERYPGVSNARPPAEGVDPAAIRADMQRGLAELEAAVGEPEHNDTTHNTKEGPAQ